MLTLVFVFFIASSLGFSQPDTSESHIRLVMREIGNEILLDAGDDYSLVLPIEKVAGRFKIQFENEFALFPSSMSDAIQRVVKRTEISERYRVEVEQCDSSIVVYGYEIGVTDSTDQIACRRRLQPKDCYIIYLTILDSMSTAANTSTFPINDDSLLTKSGTNYFQTIFIFVVLIVLVFIGRYAYKQKKQQKNQAHIINLGKYQFDQRKMLLILRSSRVELTSKEADLLALLYDSANETLEREVILNNVWGDEGDYVGRTLDVFISKLRKKLIADESVKIINVRGVGYKLILDL